MLGYKIGILSGTLIRRVIVRFAYSGIPASVPEAQGRDFAQSYLPNTLRGEGNAAHRMAQSAGHKVVVVSGGLEAYLEPWCDSHGVELICSSCNSRTESLTGRYEGRQCVLTEKACVGTVSAMTGDISDHLRVRRHAGGPDMLAIATKQYLSVARGWRRRWALTSHSSRRRLAARLNSGVRHHEGSGDHRNFEPTIRGAKRH